MLAGSGSSARVSMPRDRLVCVCFRGNLVADSEKRDRETLLQRSFQRAATKKGYYFDGVHSSVVGSATNEPLLKRHDRRLDKRREEQRARGRARVLTHSR